MWRRETDAERPSFGGPRRFALATLLVVMWLGVAATARAGQLGALVSPGPLAKAHAALEGAANCLQCHEAGRKVTAARCLTCHKPIGDRIARHTGIHRDATECVSCHAEHAGTDTELRHLDQRMFNHALQTGWALDGLHAKTVTNCSVCHKGRSFLDAQPACSSCHTDVHKPSLGADCTRCHSTETPFKQSRTRFDHRTTRFPLTGGHQEVKCEQCHKTSTFRDPALFRGREFGACAACHEDPHRRKFGTACTSCHTTETWDSQRVDHAKTAFPLVGAHTQVACVKCHQGSSMVKAVRFDQCSTCHVNVHRESIKEDCASCHSETTFKGAAFDHARRTGFALDGKHNGIACAKCHTSVSDPSVPLAKKVLDYRGSGRTCVACHAEKDPHKGEFGRTCDSCHQASTFSVKDFRHPRRPDFFAGQHQIVRCEKCHLPDRALQPVPAKTPAMECVSCHADAHLGQLAVECERCHTVADVKFAAGKFSHAQSPFPLTGKHQAVACATCHHTETRAFPSRTGTAVAFSTIGKECQACHKDPHLGQVDARCETCHQTATFAVPEYIHRGMDDFFGGFHGTYACKDCHKTETGVFPAGRGTTVRFLVGRTCASCHREF